MANFKAFLSGAARLALALVFAGVVLILSVWGVIEWQAHAKNLQEAPLATKKEWPKQVILAKLPVNVATAWREGHTYYLVSISDYSDDKYSKVQGAFITLQFNDKDGFKLWEKTIPAAELTTITGKDGLGTSGFSWTGDEYLSSDTYARGTNLEVFWGGWNTKTIPAFDVSRLNRPAPAAPDAAPKGETMLDLLEATLSLADRGQTVSLPAVGQLDLWSESKSNPHLNIHLLM